MLLGGVNNLSVINISPGIIFHQCHICRYINPMIFIGQLATSTVIRDSSDHISVEYFPYPLYHIALTCTLQKCDLVIRPQNTHIYTYIHIYSKQIVNHIDSACSVGNIPLFFVVKYDTLLPLFHYPFWHFFLLLLTCNNHVT